MFQQNKQLSLTTLAFLLSGLSGAFASPSNIVGFQLYEGNESLPPQYQHVKIIKGTIKKGTITITYSRRVADKNIEHKLKLTGNDYATCLKTVRATSLKSIILAPGAPAGGSTGFDITLIQPAGKSESGEPSNAADWVHLKGLIESRISADTANSSKGN
ncbi:MAG: hypothetical protein K2W95_30915 [Candidatus Obscuribacterales bacterium]|nr:hypothetical protein [Candidatus Obscuribacterales bacterium]